MEEGPPAQRFAAADLIGQRLGQERREELPVGPDRRIGIAAGRAARRGQLDGPLEHLEGVVVDVCVMEGALLHAPQSVELRHHHGERSDLRDQLDSGSRARHGDRAAELPEDPLAGYS